MLDMTDANESVDVTLSDASTIQGYEDYDPGAGKVGTLFEKKFLNSLYAEIGNVLVAGGEVMKTDPLADDTEQLVRAVGKLGGQAVEIREFTAQAHSIPTGGNVAVDLRQIVTNFGITYQFLNSSDVTITNASAGYDTFQIDFPGTLPSPIYSVGVVSPIADKVNSSHVCSLMYDNDGTKQSKAWMVLSTASTLWGQRPDRLSVATGTNLVIPPYMNLYFPYTGVPTP